MPLVDPRIERTRSAVHAATLRVLGERGYAAFTVEAVAADSGVAKSTIYRHWPDRVSLIADALDAQIEQPVPAQVGGSAREQTAALLQHLLVSWSGPLLPALVEAAERHPEVARVFRSFTAQRHATLLGVLHDAQQAGEVTPEVDVELVAATLVGPILFRRTLTDRPMTSAEIESLIDLVWR